jgi:hypothetical protein
MYVGLPTCRQNHKASGDGSEVRLSFLCLRTSADYPEPEPGLNLFEPGKKTRLNPGDYLDISGKGLKYPESTCFIKVET